MTAVETFYNMVLETPPMESTAKDLCSRLKPPLQNLPALSFCASKPAAVKAWAESLPATQVGRTSVMLYKVLPEFSRLQIEPEKRMAMLEALRPNVQQCIEGLSKNFLNQPLLLTDAAIKAATVAQALQKHMSNAYTVCVLDVYQAKKYHSKTLLQALHRAITGLGLMLMRSYQLYTPVRSQIWHEIYTLYLIAEDKLLLGEAFSDALQRGAKPMTLEQLCMRALLLSCVRPNQLRQQEVAAVYYALESWATKSHLVPCGEIEAQSLHLVCLDLDQPPIYRNRYQGSIDGSVRDLDNSALLYLLKELADSGADLPQQVTPTLLENLIRAWDLPSSRDFERLSVHAELQVCVGLTHVCSHLSGLSAAENSKVMKSESSRFDACATHQQEDIWDEAYDSGSCSMEEHRAFSLTPERQNVAPPVPEALQSFKVNTLDISPGGYCLNWREEMPSQARVGEVVGLKEQQHSQWNVGVIRWVQQSSRGTQLGAQLLAPMAEAVEIAMINKVGDDSRYMRALLMPALTVAKQPATLLCASMPFREHCKVYLKCDGVSASSKLQLTRRLLATSSVSQFEFRVLEGELKVKPGA